jgi:dynein heavy chain
MPVADKWGHQPVLELARQLVERGTLAYLDKGRSGDFKTCEDVYYLAAMDLAGAHPGCVPARLLRHFFMFDIGTPSEESILKIFGVVTESRFSCKEAQELEGDYIGALAAQLPSATVSVWKWVCSEMPSYHFSIHDLSRVFEGIFRAPLESISSSHYLGMLWLHECSRAMGDKLCTLVDRERLADKMRSVYRERGLPSRELQGGEEEEVVFVDFLAECGGKLTVRSSIPSYRQCPRISQLRSHITSMLECSEAGIPDQWRNIVLFDDALLHITRISRILFTPGASGVIVGPMGSGKGSAARLAALLADCWVLEPKADGAYDLAALFSDLRDLYKQAGPGKRRVTLLLGESFADRLDLLEAISSLALTGYVPGLFSTDELRLLRMESSGDMILADGAFFQLLAAQIHVLICTNPGEKFGVLQRRFPALLDHCTIYCLLPLSPNALLGAGTTMLARSGVRCEPAIRSLLALHMTAVHSAVIFAGQASEKQSGRTIHVTPQLFEQFISSYALLLSERDAEIDDMSERVCRCLDRVAASAQNVARMQAEALEEAARLADANASTSTVLQQLEESALRSASEADAVASIEASCAAEAARIKVKVKGAQDDLVAASPHLSRAELAVNSIGSDDVRELKTLQKPNDIIKLVFDCIALLRMEKMLAISTTEVTVGIGRDRRTLPFIQDSFKLIQAGMLSNDRFLRELSHFNEHRRDTINEETAELVAPYLELHGLTPDVAANVSKAAEGFCTWVHSMVSYFSASKSVRPKLDAICVAEAALEQMKLQLIDARETAHKYGAAMARLQGDFDNEMKLRRAAEAQAASMQNRADAAEGLMDALAADQERWRDMLQQLSERRRLIVGDAALAAAFLNYCGPFSQGSRKLLLQEFAGDLRARGVPCATEFSALSFFSGAGDCMEWQVQGLPCDHHALENVCLIKQSRSRRPLLLDPDSCALAWLRATIMAATPATAANERSMECDISDSRLHAILELSLSQGYPLVVSGVKSHFDHKILPLLEYPTRVSGFELIFITRLSNPQLSAEAHSRLLLVDFSLTCAGVESKLLDFILQHERSELKRQYEDVLIEQVSALKSENDLNERLLTLIGGDIGSLLDDKELINAVAETAREAANVRRALSTAAEKRANLEGEMDQYRSIAKRATSLYINFDSIPGESDLPAVILDRFLLLLTSAWDEIGRGSIASERNATLVASMNWSAFREAMRARGAKDHPRVILRFATSMLMAESSISAEEVSLLSDIFAQSAIPCQQHEIERLPDGAWGNIRRLNDISLPSVNLADEIRKDEEGWRHWCGESSPEGSSPAPSGPVRSWLLQQNRARSLFLQALIKAALCQPGRALSTLRSLIRDLDEVGSLPALGPQYLEHPSHSLDELLGQMGACAPAIFVVGSTSTPSSQIEQVAHSCCASLKCVSMGEGQTRLARAALHTAVEHGSWLLVQNCHLGIDFIEYLDDMLFAHGRHWHKNLRIFMTTESLAHFPVSLIRSSITVASDVELVL